MNGLSELTGAPPPVFPPGYPTQPGLAYAGNLAFASSDASVLYRAGSESASRRECFLATEPHRKPPRREGAAADSLAFARVLSETGSMQLRAEIDEVKQRYVFRNENTITQFISSHRTAAAVLISALPELRKSFGEDAVLSLEAVSEDDESTSLYAIVVWRGPAESAESALEEFDERWWLNQPPQPGLTFTYELA